MLSSHDLNRRFPGFTPASDERAYFEPGAGLLFPERCLAAQLRLARQDGASVHAGETVRRVTPEGSRVRVLSDRGEYLAGRVILSAGPWLADLLPQAAPLPRVQRQVLHWFAPVEPGPYRPDTCPVFIWHHGPGDVHFYGFPLAGEGGGVKLATEQFSESTHPSAVRREVGARRPATSGGPIRPDACAACIRLPCGRRSASTPARRTAAFCSTPRPAVRSWWSPRPARDTASSTPPPWARPPRSSRWENSHCFRWPPSAGNVARPTRPPGTGVAAPAPTR